MAVQKVSRETGTLEHEHCECVERLREALRIIANGKDRTDGYAPASWILSLVRDALGEKP